MTAVFSPDRLFRYRLDRHVSMAGSGRVTFVMLNPSTADENSDDATLRRCIGYARYWGYQWLTVVNLFARVATHPAFLRGNPNIVGPDNQHHQYEAMKLSDVVICAWGPNGKLNHADDEFIKWATGKEFELHYLVLTGDGSPGHPLRLPKSLRPTLWEV